jgi:hypothetical protein
MKLLKLLMFAIFRYVFIWIVICYCVIIGKHVQTDDHLIDCLKIYLKYHNIVESHLYIYP